MLGGYVEKGAPVEETVFNRKPVINVWGFKSPLMMGDTFEANVRVKTFGCTSLENASIKIIDAATGAVLASSRLGTPADTEAGELQDTLTLTVPQKAGMHKFFAVLDDGSDQIPTQHPIPLSVVPKGTRTVKIHCSDDKSGKDKSGKPLGARLFLYNTELEKTKPIDVRADENGIATAQIVPGVTYKVKAVLEDYVMAFLDIPADDAVNEFELPMRYVFNVKMKKPF